MLGQVGSTVAYKYDGGVSKMRFGTNSCRLFIGLRRNSKNNPSMDEMLIVSTHHTTVRCSTNVTHPQPADSTAGLATINGSRFSLTASATS